MFNTGLIRYLPSPVRRLVSDLMWKVADRPRFRPELSVQPGGTVPGCRTAYNRYGGYCVPLSASYRPAARKVLAGKVWEPDTIEFMIANARHADIVHAGTFFGDFIPALARAVGSDHRVWAFEPNPENARCARMTIALNDLQNVTLTAASLGAAVATVDMEVRTPRGARSGREPHRRESRQRHLHQGPDCNCGRHCCPRPEGWHHSAGRRSFEQQALSGAMDTIRRCKPVIILETLPSREWLDASILALGYREAGRLHDSYVLTPPKQL